MSINVGLQEVNPKRLLMDMERCVTLQWRDPDEY